MGLRRIGLIGLRSAGPTRSVIAVLAATPLLAAAIPSATARAAPAGASAAAPAARTARVSVSASGTWTSTGLRVRAGDLIRITARGIWTDGQATSGPAGSATRSADNFFNVADLGVCQFCATTKTVQWGSLVGYIGSSPPEPGSYASKSVRSRALKIFYVGRHYEAWAGFAGTLWLDKNADAYSNFTSDNHGHVTARVTVRPRETAAETRVRALSAVGSLPALEPLQQATTSCVTNAIHDGTIGLIGAALDELKAGEAFEGAEVTGHTIEVFEALQDGQISHAQFSFSKVVFAILSHVPIKGFQLFGILGIPALDCAEAGLWLEGQLAGQIGRQLRQKFLTPRVADASIGGNWTLTRIPLVCRNFGAGCRVPPLHLRIRHCTATRCVMSRPRSDVFWQHPHAITRHGDVWSAKFRDTAITCGFRINVANVSVRLRVIKASGPSDLATATALSGTYTVDAPTNPPNCQAHGHGEHGMHGTRS
jgi:hypothetical protein